MAFTSMRLVLPVLTWFALTTAVACAHESHTIAGPTAKTTAALACPVAIAASMAKAFPGATISHCKPERNDGRDQYEVNVENSGGDTVEADVLPNGAILQTEQAIPLEQIASRVMTAFKAKYPGAKPTGAEKQVRTGQGVFYEIKFAAPLRSKEATFAEDGTFVEEE